jgi:hypothetical protein
MNLRGDSSNIRDQRLAKNRVEDVSDDLLMRIAVQRRDELRKELGVLEQSKKEAEKRLGILKGCCQKVSASLYEIDRNLRDVKDFRSQGKNHLAHKTLVHVDARISEGSI